MERGVRGGLQFSILLTTFKFILALEKEKKLLR
jgi:hypothetical protein